MLRSGVVLALFLAAAPVGAATLQIGTPWQTSGSNTGTVGSAALTASSSHWGPDFGDQSSVYGSSAFGVLAQPGGTLGDFFRINLGASARTDTFTITFSDAIQDPVFYLIDLQGIGGTVTVTAGGTTFTHNADSTWNGNVLTVTNGYPSGGSASAAVQYQGAFAAGSVFTLQFDYSAVTSALQVDTIGIAIGTPLPEPTTSLLLGALGLGIAAGRWIRRAGA